jgi:zinc transport system substrate-binding protein
MDMMKKLRISLFTLVLLMMTAPAFGVRKIEPVKVFVSILPQANFVERIGGDLVDVGVMVTPGQSPATYSPSARRIVELSKAELYFSVGVPFEKSFMKKIEHTVAGLKIVDTRKGIKLRRMEAHHHDDHDDAGHSDNGDEHGEHGEAYAAHKDGHADHSDHGDEHGDHGDHGEAHAGHKDGHDDHHADHADHGESHDEKTAAGESDDDHHHEGSDPHIWMNPLLVKKQARTIYEALAAARPEAEPRFKAGYEAFVGELDRLHARITKVLAPLKGRDIFVFHPAYGYFADAYGLRQVPVEVEGKSPDAKTISRFIDSAKQSGVKVVFVQPQFSRRSARTIAGAIGGAVVSLDPLAREYVENLEDMAGKIEKALGN